MVRAMSMSAEKWVKFQQWRARLARRVIEVNAGRLFDAVLLPEPVWTDIMAFYNLVYTFFRIYDALPEQEQKKFKDLAEELAKIVESP